jgi:hypothetical protein
MAVEPTTKAKLVSSRELSKIVDEAVKAAAGRTPAGGGAGAGGGTSHNLILSPEILGRILREAEGQHFAQAVAKGVEKTGINVQPVVLPIGHGWEIAGFIERDALQAREF